MRKPRTTVDSYTGQVWEEPYVSPIPGIMRGRQSFYKRGLAGGPQAGYEITPVPSPSPSTEPVPAADLSWELGRMACDVFPPQALLTFPSYEQARRAADWALRNDDSVKVTLHWITKGDIEPFLRLLDVLTEAAQ